jgi:hypothetical protein
MVASGQGYFDKPEVLTMRDAPGEYCMNKTNRYLMAVLLLGTVQQVMAQDVFIYPGKGQSAEQQDKDEYECYSWAKANTGYDPATPAATAAAPEPAAKQTGGVARGAVGGAAIGAIAGDSSEAAGRGAAAGAVFGGIKQRRANQQSAEQQQQQQSSQSTAEHDNYNRAYAACLEGRGYTVK